ncbi:proteasome maturation protein-like [Elysia marginata]|uniref:Proteasome maturation protein-like n=1 Tax=Elysia marginata TaxID=1093978 RepID=A0AAV4I8D0_9GAST|nr:proteasome maturation protein-like [Elysia marginata]
MVAWTDKSQRARVKDREREGGGTGRSFPPARALPSLPSPSPAFRRLGACPAFSSLCYICSPALLSPPPHTPNTHAHHVLRCVHHWTYLGPAAILVSSPLALPRSHILLRHTNTDTAEQVQTSISGYPTLRPQPACSKTVDLPKGPYGVPDSMMHGFQASRAATGLGQAHPLQASEEQWLDHKLRMDFVMLKNSQGVHAPLKLKMENFAASKMQRLPCLNSSNLMADILSGREEFIGFEDILNNPADSEVMGQPHAMLERRMGLL